MELLLKKKQQLNNAFMRVIPYVLIAIASLFGAWILVYKGYPTGDDVAYHFSNMYDMYTDLQSGDLSKISNTLASGLGFGKNLFYSPLSHLTTVLIALAFKGFGMTLMQAFKFNMYLSVFLSGCIMYHFAMHITKKNIASIVVAFIYVLHPYRFFDMFCRLAVAEAYAFLFIPLFFMGLYDLVHLKERKLMPFLEIILGGSLLFLTHNITSIYAYLFGGIYLIFHIKDIIRLIKLDKSLLPIALVSCVLLLGITAGTLFSALSLYNEGIYNVSNEVRMWTSKEYLSNRSDYNWYSGLINLEYFTKFNSGITNQSAILDAVVFGLLSMGFVVMDSALDSIPKVKIYKSIGLAILAIVLSFFVFTRTEVRLAVILFQLGYIVYRICTRFRKQNLVAIVVLAALAIGFYGLSMTAKKNVCYIIALVVFGLLGIFYSIRKRKLDIDYWYLIASLLAVLLLICVGNIWNIMPSTLRGIQFPWRLWCYASFFLTMLAAYVLRDTKLEELTVLGLSMASFLLVVSQAIPEKNIAHDKYINGTGSGWMMEIDDSLYVKGGSIGACREYFPYMYYSSDTYESEYSNSLYPKVKKYFAYSNYIGTKQDLKPVVLEGNGTVSEYQRADGIVTMKLKVEEDSLIQIPLIYYPGYSIKLNDEIVEELNVDGLVSFNAKVGEYEVTIIYEGTKAMKLAEAYQNISVYGLFIFSLGMVLFEKRRKELF